MKRYLIPLSAVLLVFLVFLIYKKLSTPLPGEFVTDLGREHVEDGTEVEYNSNPPTSGSHYADWTRAGVYSKPVSDGHLVHSLEHGYVILSYNCSLKTSFIPQAFAHEEELTPATQMESSPSAELVGKEWESEECKSLANSLFGVYEKKGKRKLIVIPRPSLDTKIALTAWTRIDKFSDFNEERIVSFIDAFRDKGPEQTME